MATVRELTPEDASALTSLYEEYEWWEDRKTDRVRRAIVETPVAIGIAENGELIAAARVLTDYVYYATVYDVIVARAHRGEGYGEKLLARVRDHPDLQDLERLSLLCRRNLVPFYESVGFELFDPEIDVPEGGTEEMVRMTYEYPEEQ